MRTPFGSRIVLRWFVRLPELELLLRLLSFNRTHRLPRAIRPGEQQPPLRLRRERGQELRLLLPLFVFALLLFEPLDTQRLRLE